MLQDADWHVDIVHRSPRGRILVMDSMGYVDHRCDVSDVVVCGSHSAVCAAQLSARARPRGIIGHDGGMGRDRGGVAGLDYWQRLKIPGAAVEASTARVGDGRDIWDRGRIGSLNELARSFGVGLGMPVQEAAQAMLENSPLLPKTRRIQRNLYNGAEGRIVGIDTVIYADERMADSVMVMAGHTGEAFARYVFALPFKLRGIVNIDGGKSADGSGISGLPLLDERGVPVAVCDVDTVLIGDARDVFANGRISHVSSRARSLGVEVGTSARDAAFVFLRAGATA
ncbi:MAG TPA: hypothetical protein VMF90_22120 [Rhizobiaceae bacterium]|nr:hypothetical protein [Rhizobiaceae bacterium]